MHAQRECRLPSRKHYGETGFGRSGGPVFDGFPAGQIEHLSQRIIVGEVRLVLGNLAELAVQALNDIGRV